MGVPAYEKFSAGMEWPPFDLLGMTGSIQKRLAGNDPRLGVKTAEVFKIAEAAHLGSNVTYIVAC